MISTSASSEGPHLDLKCVLNEHAIHFKCSNDCVSTVLSRFFDV
jgi:hypothetical protein